MESNRPEPRRRKSGSKPQFTRIVWTVVLCSVAVLGINHLLGQPLYCRCGSQDLWSDRVFSSHRSQHLLDPYSLTHVMHGVLLSAFLAVIPIARLQSWRFQVVMVLESLWEVLENSPLIIHRYRTATVSLDYLGDSLGNSLGDLLSCCAGYLLLQVLGFRKSAAIFLASELLLVLTIRDCLLLNILMLAWPIDAVRQWQLQAAF